MDRHAVGIDCACTHADLSIGKTKFSSGKRLLQLCSVSSKRLTNWSSRQRYLRERRWHGHEPVRKAIVRRSQGENVLTAPLQRGRASRRYDGVSQQQARACMRVGACVLISRILLQLQKRPHALLSTRFGARAV